MNINLRFMMYYKYINDRQVFSDCRTIHTNDDVWISNPTAEQIANDGWLEYIPPTIEPTPMTEPDTYDIIEAVRKMLASSVVELSDEDALNVAALYPTWSSKIGQTVNVGERYWYDGKLYKVIQSHMVLENWTPDASASLFVEVSIEEWPEFVQPIGQQDSYMTGDKVTYNGKHYISLMDYNVYSPDAYQQGWEEQP